MTEPKLIADVEQLVEDFNQSGLRELHVRHGDFEIYLSQDADAPGLDGPRVAVDRVRPAASGASTASAVPAPPAVPVAVTSGSNPPEGAVLVRAPYLGTFYRSPKPGSPPYVQIGGLVMPDSEVCLVEVMKLFTAVRAGVEGRIVEVLAGDGELVVADQPLFVIAQE